MEKKKKTKIRKWDEVGGAVETEIEEVAGSFERDSRCRSFGEQKSYERHRGYG